MFRVSAPRVLEAALVDFQRLLCGVAQDQERFGAVRRVVSVRRDDEVAVVLKSNALLQRLQR